MEMELCKGEIQSHCTDISDAALALIRSALFVRSVSFLKNDVELITHNKEQFNKLDQIINDVMTNFTDYYYVVGDNYTEHPYFMATIVEGEPLENYYENYFTNNPIFKVEHEKLSDTTTKVLFSIKDKDKCIQALDEYCLSYGFGMVCNDNTNILTCEAQDKQLYNLLTENDYNLNNFIITDLKYIKALCYNEHKNKLAILSIDFEFSEDNKLMFKCTIADEGFVEGYGKDDTLEDVKTETKAKTDEPKKVRKHFSPSVQDLYNYVKRYAPAKNYEIYKEDLIGEDRRNKLYCGMGELTTAVNRLNQQYKEISGSTKPLMKYDKFLDCYIITNIWED